jgi:hypothetical protein
MLDSCGGMPMFTAYGKYLLWFIQYGNGNSIVWSLLNGDRTTIWTKVGRPWAALDYDQLVHEPF